MARGLYSSRLLQSSQDALSVRAPLFTLILGLRLSVWESWVHPPKAETARVLGGGRSSRSLPGQVTLGPFGVGRLGAQPWGFCLFGPAVLTLSEIPRWSRHAPCVTMGPGGGSITLPCLPRESKSMDPGGREGDDGSTRPGPALVAGTSWDTPQQGLSTARHPGLAALPQLSEQLPPLPPAPTL